METVPFADAAELLEALRPSSPSWIETIRNWVFRGHADSEWPLLPTALRLDSRPRPYFGPKSGFGPFKRQEDQVNAEFEVLDEVLGHCDMQGTSFPDDHHLTRHVDVQAHTKLVEDMAASRPDLWPPDIHLSQLAMCQHYGAPTRLLDWTRRPLFAAYFAASTAAAQLDHGRTDQRLAVWALHKGLLTTRLSGVRQAGERVELVTGPGGQIPNLAAQAGCFTLVRARSLADGSVDRRPLDEVAHESISDVGALYRSRGVDPTTIHWLIRFTLPVSESRALLRGLHDEFVTPATLFPGYSGAVRAAQDRGLWHDE